MLPGNTADATVLLPVVDRLRERFISAGSESSPTASGKPGSAFEIDPGKPAKEARYDGLFVLRMNARITPLQAVLRYRNLLQVEALFRRAKAILKDPPRSIIPQMPPSAAMCSARFSP